MSGENSITVTMQGLTRSTLQGLFWMFLGKGAQGALQLLVLIILARLLTPADFGVVAAALVLVGFASIFSQLGVGPAVVQRPHLETRHLRTAFTLSLTFGTALTGLIWLFAPSISSFFRIAELTTVAQAMSLMFLLQSTSIVAESLLQNEKRKVVNVVKLKLPFGPEEPWKPGKRVRANSLV